MNEQILQILSNFGIAGALIIVISYGAYVSGSWLGKKAIIPMVQKHIEFVDECIIQLRMLHQKIDTIHNRIKEM
jgi:hypothetical protein